MQRARDERIEETERGCEGTRDLDLYVWLDQAMYFWSCKNLLQKARKRVQDVRKERMQ